MMKPTLLASAAALVLAAGAPVRGQEADSDWEPPRLPSGVPDFSSNNAGWVGGGINFEPAPGYDMVPVGPHPDHPYCANNISEECGFEILPPIGDWTNPILQEWAAEFMEAEAQDALAGHEPFQAMSRCWPGGVPTMMIFTQYPAFFVQTEDKVTIIYVRGPWVRHVYLDAEHSADPEPTWFGESVGWYEDDTLVIDTVGQNDFTQIGWYGVPHTEQLHVVERYRIINNGEAGEQMEGIFVADDPGTFTGEYAARRVFRNAQVPISNTEYVCAENNVDFYGEGLTPMPEASTPDF